MCGIAGWFDLSGERVPQPRLLQAMTDAIAHRGPDGDGFHFAPGVGLGHRRLAIIDLNTGAQPMYNASRSVCIVFNGEIYNYRELRSDLEARGRRFVTSSDTEVVIQSWEEWGEKCLERLRGMFALALFDETAGTLFLARDRLGEKPLYYAELSDGSLIFGSELKALLVHPALRREIDPCAVEEYFALGYIAEPRTIYRTVKRLAAGNFLLAKRGAALPAPRAYWDANPKPVRASAAELEDTLIEKLGASTKAQLVADVPVGAFLSGGTDSSGTTALMAKASADPIHCFTIGFEDPRFDETRYARMVAERYGARHEIEIATGDDLESVHLLSGIFDEPFGDSSALPTYLLARLAARSVKVALSGDGGDELFAGYRRYAFHVKEEAVRRALPSPIRSLLFGLPARIYPQLDWAPRAFRARHTLEELGASTADGYFMNVSVIEDRDRRALYAKPMHDRLGDYSARDVIASWMAQAPSQDPLTIAQYVDIKTWLPSDILTKVDRAAMASSLEVRVPMLDHDFVDWALGLPEAMKLSGGEGKAIFKRALERLLPREILYRPKQGFSVPLADWFRGNFGRAFETVLANSDHSELAEYVDIDVVKSLLKQHRGGTRDHSRTLWLVWMFERFLSGVHARIPQPLPEIESQAARRNLSLTA
jgi:asparagine synthase (glutamine-hydrolysing)